MASASRDASDQMAAARSMRAPACVFEAASTARLVASALFASPAASWARARPNRVRALLCTETARVQAVTAAAAAAGRAAGRRRLVPASSTSPAT